MKLRHLIAYGLTAVSSMVQAQAWPTKPVRIVVPAPAASSLDVIARTLADKLSPIWGQPVLVDNKPGAGGQIGVGMAAKSAPDGTTLAIGFNGPIAFGPFMYAKMPYDPAKELAPIVLTTSQPNVFAVSANVPAKTLQEFVAWAKQQGDKVSYGSIGNGSSSHLTMELLKSAAGFSAVHVPYNGSPPAAASLAAGDTQALFAVETAMKPLVQSGKVKLLAATGATRPDILKDLPTVAESGYPGFEAMAWNGLFAAAGTPTEIINKINADVNAVFAMPAVRESLLKQGLLPGGGSVNEFKNFIDAEVKRWGPVIKAAGVKVE